MQEDALSNPNSPEATCCFPGVNVSGHSETPIHGIHARHSLVGEMNKVDGKYRQSDASYNSDIEFSSEAKTSPVIATPSRSRVWCVG